MAEWSLVKLSYRAGRWEGRLTAPAKSAQLPDLELRAGETAVAGLAAKPDGKGAWLLAAPIPGEALGDGIAAFVLLDKTTGSPLARFALAAGEPADDELRAEVALLRAELDLLKKAVRRLAAKDG